MILPMATVIKDWNISAVLLNLVCRPQRLVSYNHFHPHMYARARVCGCMCVYAPEAINY